MLRICRDLGDRNNEGQSLNNLGNVYGQQQRWEAAIQVYEESLPIKQEWGNRHNDDD